MITLDVTSRSLADVAADAIIVFHESGGVLATSDNAVLQKHFDSFAKSVETKKSKREWFCTLPKDSGVKTEHLLLESSTFGAWAPHDEPLKMAAARAVAMCRDHGLRKLVFAAHHTLAPAKATAIVEGVLLGDFRDRRFKGTPEGTKKEEEKPLLVSIAVPEAQLAAVRTAVDRTETIIRATNHARELVNAPHNVLTPDALANEAKEISRHVGLRATVLNEKQLKAQGYSLLHEVGRGSEYPPRMIVLRYEPKKPVGEHIGLIGKGITFDTGGLCIKTKEIMHNMNNDMGGAAAVLGAMEAVAQLGLPLRITAIIPAAHNATDGAAYTPGCIITTKSGKTVYVENTDAEGRLVLADGFQVAAEEGVELMWDFATLTGAVSMALGSSIAGLFTNEEDLRALLMEAGANTGDDLWPLPLVREYEGSIQHHLADIQNMSTDPKGGAIHAANFLKAFVPKGVRWAHVDMAGVAAGKGRRYFRPGATGYGVRLIVEALELYLKRVKPE